MKFSSRKILESLILHEDGSSADEFLGDEEFDELLSQQKKAFRKSRTKKATKGRVYILPGIMGSTLFGDREFWPDDWIWISPLDLAAGAIRKLKIGAEPNPVYARDALDLLYLKLKLRLRNADYDADYLPFDWRHSPNEIGQNLFNGIKNRGEKNVSLVCHSMGGLLARQIASLDPDGEYIKKVITLATPNYGSYSPVQVFSRTHSTVRLLAKIDQFHSEDEIINDYVKYFRGLLEMLPDNRIRPKEDYFNLKKWPSSSIKPDKNQLRLAKDAKQNLASVDERFVQIIGMNKDTIQSASVKNNKFLFELNNDGDGTVPRDLAEMGTIDRYYINGKHRKVPSITTAIKGVIDILDKGKTSKLRRTPFKTGEGESKVRTLSENQMRNQNKILPKKDIDNLFENIISEQLIS